MELLIGITIGSLIGTGGTFMTMKNAFEKSKDRGFVFAKTPEQKQIIMNEQKKEILKLPSWLFMISMISVVLILGTGRIILGNAFNLTNAFISAAITFFISYFLSLLVVKFAYNLWLSKKNA